MPPELWIDQFPREPGWTHSKLNKYSLGVQGCKDYFVKLLLLLLVLIIVYYYWGGGGGGEEGS